MEAGLLLIEIKLHQTTPSSEHPSMKSEVQLAQYCKCMLKLSKGITLSFRQMNLNYTTQSPAVGKRHSSTRQERRGVSFVQAKPFCLRLWCDELESMSFKQPRAVTARCCTQQQSAQHLMPRGSIRCQTIQMFPSSEPGQLLRSCLKSGFVCSCARPELGKRLLVAPLQVLTFWQKQNAFV